MPHLSISKFSCLGDARFSLAPVNILIGPQGSGKSVTTKLFYFCADILSQFLLPAERGIGFDKYREHVAQQFALWFPPSAWGNERFNISYNAGHFNMRILRKLSKGKVSDGVTVSFSDWFEDIYKKSVSILGIARSQSEESVEIGATVGGLDRVFHVRDEITQQIHKDLGKEYIGQQTFIPAGRAFFTTIGRLVAGIEQGVASLDPVTLKFARLFANLRDRNAYRSLAYLDRLGPDLRHRRTEFMASLFGGEVKFDNDTEYVDTPDGRRIPFSALSSGQQELLPMWLLLDYFNELDARRNSIPTLKRRRFPTELAYVEEPEAHLFPSAQSRLMEFLLSTAFSSSSGRHLIITTHSPYIMGRLNLFLKAGQLARRKKRNEQINEVVPRECWLTKQRLSALAIENGGLRNLIGDDDLIDASYLDHISESMSSEFDRLLDIEMGM